MEIPIQYKMYNNKKINNKAFLFVTHLIKYKMIITLI